MNKLIRTTVIAILLLSQPVHGETITEQSFVGHWCGKWDDIYSFCLTIENIKSDAKYRWQEFTKGKFKKTKKKIERVNRNTLKIDNIWFALDEKDLNQANIMGIFQSQTRISRLQKSIINSQ